MEYQPASGSSYILGAKAFPRIRRPNLRYAEASSPYPSPVVPVFGTSPRLEPRQQGSPDPADPRGCPRRSAPRTQPNLPPIHRIRATTAVFSTVPGSNNHKTVSRALTPSCPKGGAAWIVRMLDRRWVLVLPCWWPLDIQTRVSVVMVGKTTLLERSKIIKGLTLRWRD